MKGKGIPTVPSNHEIHMENSTWLQGPGNYPLFLNSTSGLKAPCSGLGAVHLNQPSSFMESRTCVAEEFYQPVSHL